MSPAMAVGKQKFGFVLFAKMSTALKAVKDVEKYELDGPLFFIMLGLIRTTSLKMFMVVFQQIFKEEREETYTTKWLFHRIHNTSLP
ncbi:hypothetical protein Lser_V15G18272 [Lactuca serriola]